MRPLCAAVRGFALFLGAFAAGTTLLGLDANAWWIDLRPLAPPAQTALLAAAGALLVAWALRPDGRAVRRAATVGTAGTLAVVALANAATVLRLDKAGLVRAPAVPLSVLVAVGLACVAVAALRPRERSATPAAAWALVFAGLFPLAQMTCFGATDYRRRADAIVVLGARTYADGRASTALADRVRTACALWHEGLAPRLVFSGGPGDGGVHETEAMRRLAVELRVPDAAISLDADGTSTRATAANVSRLLADEGCRDALVVSHAYHLPRVKLAFDRAGLRVFTVPARETRTIPRMPWFVARETVALWTYLLDPR